MRLGLALLLVGITAGCQSMGVPVSRETQARLPTGNLVALPRLAADLDLDYRGDEQSAGVIELSAPPDHVMLVQDSTRALVNGTSVTMDYPCMRRGADYVLTLTDAGKLQRTLNRIRSRRGPPRALPPMTIPKASPSGLPAAWRPGPGVPVRDWRSIVIHHTASRRGSAASIDLLHKQRGWDGLGYDFVIGNGSITADGAIEVGYRWRKQAIGAHARVHKGDDNWWNEHAIGICLVGNFEERKPSQAQMRSLVKLVKALQRTYRIPTSKILPHRKVGKTLCPGSRFPWEKFIASLR